MQNNLHPLFAGIINDIARMNGILNEAEPVPYILTEVELDELAGMINSDLYFYDTFPMTQCYELSSCIIVQVKCDASFSDGIPNIIDGYTESIERDLISVDIIELDIINPRSDLEFDAVYDKTQLEKKIIF